MKMVTVSLVVFVTIVEITLQMPLIKRHGTLSSVGKHSNHGKEYKRVHHNISTFSPVPVNETEEIVNKDVEKIYKSFPVHHIRKKNKKHWVRSKPWKKLKNNIFKLPRRPGTHRILKSSNTTHGKQTVAALLNPMVKNSNSHHNFNYETLVAKGVGSLEGFNNHVDSIDEESCDVCSRHKQDNEPPIHRPLVMLPTNITSDIVNKTHVTLPIYRPNGGILLAGYRNQFGNVSVIQPMRKNQTNNAKSLDHQMEKKSKTLVEVATKLNRSFLDSRQSKGLGTEIDKFGNIKDLNLLRLNVSDIVRIETKISVKKNANGSDAQVKENDRVTQKYVITNMKVEKDNIMEHLDSMVKQSANKVMLMDKSILDEYLSKKASSGTPNCIGPSFIVKNATTCWKFYALFLFSILVCLGVMYFCCQRETSKKEVYDELDETQAQKEKLVRFKSVRTSTSPNSMYKTFDTTYEPTQKCAPQQYPSQPCTEKPCISKLKKCKQKHNTSVPTSDCHCSPKKIQQKHNTSVPMSCYNNSSPTKCKQKHNTNVATIDYNCSPKKCNQNHSVLTSDYNCSATTSKLFNEFKKYEGSLFKDFSRAVDNRKKNFQQMCYELGNKNKQKEYKDSLLNQFDKEEECNETELDVYNYEGYRPLTLKKPRIINYRCIKAKSKQKDDKRHQKLSHLHKEKDKVRMKSRKSHSLRQAFKHKSDDSP